MKDITAKDALHQMHSTYWLRNPGSLSPISLTVVLDGLQFIIFTPDIINCSYKDVKSQGLVLIFNISKISKTGLIFKQL